LGLQRGAEEITRQLNRVYGALIDAVHRYGGSVINISGDAITCWFDEAGVGSWELGVGERAPTPNSQLPTPAALRAVACALAMQAALVPFATIATPAGTMIALAIKVVVGAGPARRLLVGDPHIQHIEALAGQLIDELAIGDQLATRGDVLVQAAIVEALGTHMTIAGWRSAADSGTRFARVTDLTEAVPTTPWPDVPPDGLTEAQCRPWLLASVYERIRSGKSAFLSELRGAAALFFAFQGIDYHGDDRAGAKLDRVVRWVQTVVARYAGALLQLTIGDKGSYMYAAFGAPVAHEDDAVRAVAAALDMQTPPAELQFITDIRIGVAYGQMRSGAYGSSAQRTYGVLGDKTNLAARLMQAAPGGILCDEAIYHAARSHLHFDSLPPIIVKGKAHPVAVYRPASKTMQSAISSRIDQLAPAHQLTLKVASVIGPVFAADLLRDIYPIDADKPHIEEHLQVLDQSGLVARHPAAATLSYTFGDSLTWEAVYNRLLFAQRRQLHRAVAEWYECMYANDLASYYSLLAYHWGKAEDSAKTIAYLEHSGEQARQRGDYQQAIGYLNESLALNAQAGVLSADYYTDGDLAPPSPPIAP